jgi:hypothetical protein
MADNKMTDNVVLADGRKLVCSKCHQEMVLSPVTVNYMTGMFNIELLRCPNCGLIYVPESLATGQMKRVEQSLEDK